jgi:hypothetical protein
MALRYRTPGVYREEVFLKPEARLPTGVAGFVGFAEPRKDQQGKELVKPNEPVALHHADDFTRYFERSSESYLAAAVAGFFLNGGVRCYAVRADPLAGDRKESLIKAVQALAPLDDLDLLAVPDAMTLRRSDLTSSDGAFVELQHDAIIDLQGRLLDHCENQGNRFAILDALPILPQATDVLEQREMLGAGQTETMNGALYCPWLRIQPETGSNRLVPPCGHVAGIFARTDAKVGVFKAPANEEIAGVLDLESDTGGEQDRLNAEGINCLRALPGRGIRVWGARTLSREPQWRYVNVRRLFITLRRWINMNMTWVTFEPNTAHLWMRIQRELSSYLNGLWQAGALQGETPQQAFYVKCDGETNPADSPGDRVVSEIGLAPTVPAEFVVVHIIHRPDISVSLA